LLDARAVLLLIYNMRVTTAEGRERSSEND